MTTTTSERPTTRRPALLLAAGLALALVPAACGGSSPGDDRDAAPARDAAATGAFPVTIAQAPGEVTIDQEPARVVALDLPSADAAIALGVVPVGMAELSYVDGGVQEWTRTALSLPYALDALVPVMAEAIGPR